MARPAAPQLTQSQRRATGLVPPATIVCPTPPEGLARNRPCAAAMKREGGGDARGDARFGRGEGEGDSKGQKWREQRTQQTSRANSKGGTRHAGHPGERLQRSEQRHGDAARKVGGEERAPAVGEPRRKVAGRLGGRHPK